MKPLLSIIDTNVLVAGLITVDPQSPVCRILDAMLKADFPFLVSPPLLKEYQAVLSRPRIRQLHNLEEREVEEILTAVAANAIVREAQTAGEKAPDQDDQFLWDLLAAYPQAVLVTGDKRLQDKPPAAGSLLSPQEFLSLIEAAGPE